MSTLILGVNLQKRIMARQKRQKNNEYLTSGKFYDDNDKFGKDKFPIHPKNEKQREMMEAILDYDLTIAYGLPGTAKTLISIYMAFEFLDCKESSIDKIIVTRNNCIASGSRDIGALPGTLEEKTDYNLEPLFDNCRNFMTQGRINYIKKRNGEKKQIEFVPYQHIRGRSFDDAFIIVEEAQNFTSDQMYTIATRAGKRSKMVINGDYMTQRDLPTKHGKTGLEDLLEVVSDDPETAIINFDNPDHVCRSGLAKRMTLRYYYRR